MMLERMLSPRGFKIYFACFLAMFGYVLWHRFADTGIAAWVDQLQDEYLFSGYYYSQLTLVMLFILIAVACLAVGFVHDFLTGQGIFRSRLAARGAGYRQRKQSLNRIEKLFAKLDARKVRPVPIESEEVRKSIRRCLDACRRVKSYRAVYLTTGGSHKEYETKWWMDFGSPNRLHAEQHHRPEDFWDEWVTIGRRHYPAVRFPIEQRPSKLDPSADSLNRMLRLDDYLEILQRMAPTRVGVCQKGRVRYSVLDYSGKARDYPGDDPFSSHPDAGWKITVWIDATSGVIAKAVRGERSRRQGSREEC